VAKRQAAATVSRSSLQPRQTDVTLTVRRRNNHSDTQPLYYTRDHTGARSRNTTVLNHWQPSNLQNYNFSRAPFTRQPTEYATHAHTSNLVQWAMP